MAAFFSLRPVSARIGDRVRGWGLGTRLGDRVGLPPFHCSQVQYPIVPIVLANSVVLVYCF